MKRAAVIFLTVIMVSLASCGGAPKTEGEPEFPMRGEVPVSEKTVRFLGRYYESEGVYYTNLSCSGFEVRFEGTELKAEFISEPTDADHNTYIHVFVDDVTALLEKTEAGWHARRSCKRQPHFTGSGTQHSDAGQRPGGGRP